MALPTRKIGNTDVSAVGYGAMGIAAFYGQVQSDEERLKVSCRLRPSALLVTSLLIELITHSCLTLYTTPDARIGTQRTCMETLKSLLANGQKPALVLTRQRS